MSKPILGRMSFEIFVDCPHCEETFDLIDHEDNAEGFWSEKFADWISNKPEANKIKEDVLCPECDKRVDILGLEY